MLKVTYEVYDEWYGLPDPIVLIDYDDERFSLFRDHRNETDGYTVMHRIDTHNDVDAYEYVGTFTTMCAACIEIFFTVK